MAKSQALSRRSLLLGTGALAFVGIPAGAQYQPQGNDLAARLAALQATDGALLLPGDGDMRLCDPCSASMGVYGLLLGAPPRARRQSAIVATRWIQWYLDHLDADGDIGSFQGPAGSLRAHGKFDHQDAAAGAFLAAVLAYYEQTGGAALVLEHFPTLVKVADRLLARRQKSGLTHARADRPVAFLANNVRAWLGLDHFARLCLRLRKRRETREYAPCADEALSAIDKWLWSPLDGHYAWALHPDGRRETGLDAWRPNRHANLLAISTLPADTRRSDLLTRMRRVEVREVTAPSQLDEFVAWSLAGVAEGYAVDIERRQVRLAKAPWADIRDLPPELIGDCLRLGQGRLGPPPLE